MLITDRRRVEFIQKMLLQNFGFEVSGMLQQHELAMSQ